MVLALASTMAPAFGQVSVSLGTFDGKLDVLASAALADVKNTSVTYRRREAGDFQTLGASVPVSKRFGFQGGWHSNSLGLGRNRNRAEGVVAGFTGNYNGPAGFLFVYGVRGYPGMDNDSRGTGWSVGARRNLGEHVRVYANWEWDRFWANRGPASVKSAGVSAGFTFTLGG